MIDLSGVSILDMIPHQMRGSSREMYGPCPICGGRDRFHVKQLFGKDMFFCRTCHPKWGDAIEYVMWTEGCPFKEACERLGASRDFMPRQPRPAIEEVDIPPDLAWQKAAARLISDAETALWSNKPYAVKARAWLNARGLTDQTIKLARLGLLQEAKRYYGLWAYRGITIPTIVFGVVWQVRIRIPPHDVGREIPGTDRVLDKYMCVTGGKIGLHGADQSDAPTLIVAGEFDALIAKQECDSLRVVTFGSESKRFRKPWTLAIDYICYDNDDAGWDGALSMACQTGGRIICPPIGKDITDSYLGNSKLTKEWLHGLCSISK